MTLATHVIILSLEIITLRPLYKYLVHHEDKKHGKARDHIVSDIFIHDYVFVHI
jgi:hypothetical protein